MLNDVRHFILFFLMIPSYPTPLHTLFTHPSPSPPSLPLSHSLISSPSFSTRETRQNSERRSLCFHITYVPFLRRTAHPSRKRPLERCHSSIQKAKVRNIFIYSFIVIMIVSRIFYGTFSLLLYWTVLFFNLTTINFLHYVSLYSV